MATNRKRTPRSRKDTGLTGADEMFVYGKTDKHVNPFEYMELCHNELKQRPLWEANLKNVLADWIAENPCTRPGPFWLLDITENRLGSDANHYARYLQDKAVTDFAKKVKDNPAAQARYLHEHDLLTAVEKTYLKKHPELLQPETPPWCRQN